MATGDRLRNDLLAAIAQERARGRVPRLKESLQTEIEELRRNPARAEEESELVEGMAQVVGKYVTGLMGTDPYESIRQANSLIGLNDVQLEIQALRVYGMSDKEAQRFVEDSRTVREAYKKFADRN